MKNSGLLILSFVLIACLPVFSQNTPGNNAKDTKHLQRKIASGKLIKTDTSKKIISYVRKARLESYRRQPAFQYAETPPQQLSLWDRFWIWFWNMVQDALAYSGRNPVLKIVFIAAGAFIILYVIFKLYRSDNLFISGAPKNDMDYTVFSENIYEIDYDQQLKLLVSEGKYRLAVRLLYLRSLKELGARGIIYWEPGKTNHAYLNEMKKESMRQPFSALTKQFDYIWYGHFPVNAETYQPIARSFDHFNELIK